MSPPPARGSPSGVKQHQPALQGLQGLQGHFQGECRDYRDPLPQNDEEADVASLARDAVRRPSGLEKGLRERTTNSSSGAVVCERRVPSPAGIGATRTRPTRPSHCEARGKGGVQADGEPRGRSAGWGIVLQKIFSSSETSIF
jgi:hypothetical protein